MLGNEFFIPIASRLSEWRKRQSPLWLDPDTDTISDRILLRCSEVMRSTQTEDAFKGLTEIANAYLTLVMKHRWSRSGWIERLIYQTQVEFPQRMAHPEVPVPMPFREAMNGERLLAQMKATLEIEMCTEIVMGKPVNTPPGYSGVEVETEMIEQYQEEILRYYETLELPTDETAVLLSELFDDATFCRHFHNALLKLSEAEDCLISSIMETFRRLKNGPDFVEPETQAPTHTPPLPTHIETEGGTLGKILSKIIYNSENETLDDGMFYFAFGVEASKLHPNPISRDRERIHQGKMGESYANIFKSLRVSLGLEMLMTFLGTGRALV